MTDRHAVRKDPGARKDDPIAIAPGTQRAPDHPVRGSTIDRLSGFRGRLVVPGARAPAANPRGALPASPMASLPGAVEADVDRTRGVVSS